MSNVIKRARILPLPPINLDEVLRYMGAGDGNKEIISLVRECVNESKDCFDRRVCYRKFDIVVSENVVDLGFTRVFSRSLAKNLKDCSCAVLFAATVGLSVDRLIAKYSRLSPSRALCLQALGTERVEALCDAFCTQISKEYGNPRPRFSPGYGDLPLELQKDIFRVLDCPKSIGLSLNDSLLMSPTKSVTAIVGISR